MIGMGKKQTSITLDSELAKWIDEKIAEKRFASTTHAIEYALQKLRREES
jgi:Arc/MetJ-type ribon-helix-helix transcriptional regulator